MRKIGIIMLIGLLLSSQTVLFAQESSQYAIQMGLFNKLANAEQLYEKLMADGHDAALVKEGNYVVYFGYYANYDAAKKELPSAQKYVKNAYIVKIKSEDIAEGTLEATLEDLSEDTPLSTDINLEPENPEIVVETDEPIVDTNLETDAKAYNQLVGNDLLLQGVYGQASIFFTVNKYWNVSDIAYFDLYFQHSYTGVERGSSITIELNGVPVESFFVDSLGSGEHFKRIVLPKEIIQNDFNEIKISTYHRITDLICEDDGNPANWVTVFGKSYLHLEYDDQQVALDLGTYPFPYVKDYEDQPVQFDFLVEDHPSVDTLKTMMTLASDVGRRVKFKNIHFSITELKDMKDNMNYIYVGTSLPEKLKPYFNQVKSENIYVAQSVLKKPYSILAIVSLDSESLYKIASGLANDIWKDQLSGNWVAFDTDDLSYQFSTEDKNIFELSELGYSNITLEGAKTSSAQYFVDIPDNWTLEKEASIVLKLRYAKVIDYENSSVSVVINNIPVGSEILSEEGADSDIITFKIPEELKESKAFAISINLYLDGDFDCQDGTINTNYWAFISNESSLYLPHVPKLKYNLNHYPAPFVSDFHMDDVNFVLDNLYSMDDVNMLVDIVGYLSHEISNVPEFSLTFDKGLADKHNIYVTGLNSNLFKSINSTLNIPYMFQMQQFESQESRRLLDPFNKNLSTVQLLSHSNSPFMDLVITYQGGKGYRWISPYLTDLEFVGKLGGNAIFVDQNGYYQIFDTKSESETNSLTLIDQNLVSQPKRVSYENSRNFLIFLGFMLLVIVIIIIVIAARSKRSIK